MKKIKKFFIFALAILGVISMLSIGCKKSSDDSNNNPPVTTITDKDGNVYHSVTIGTQVWMVENLRTTKYNDGTSIPTETVDNTWLHLTTPAYCWYNNDASYKNTYGALYNWFAVNTGKLAPMGWHVPTDVEWHQLTDYLGGEILAGGKMKSKGTIQSATGLWTEPNTGASNSSGFNAVPGGGRSGGGSFFAITEFALFWSSTQYDDTKAWYRNITNEGEDVYHDNFRKQDGMSVRCIKD